VLSVGDAQFQAQCVQRMEEIINDGRTLIFVSHGTALVQQVCRRAMFLQKGRMMYDGDTISALAAYAQSLQQDVNATAHAAASQPA
jgi:homopolymeric O-antigen transport system ATP-binding protein